MFLTKTQLKRQYYTLGFCSATLLVTLTGKSSLAFTIIPSQPGASVFYQPSQAYSLADGSQGITELDPLSITSIARGGTTDFLDKLLETFPDWTFNSADKDLAGTFEIGVYQALGLSTGLDPGVGAELQLRYLPASSYNPTFNYNPTSESNELHWIQRVVNNHALIPTLSGTINLGHGTLEDKIDVFQEQTDPSSNVYNPFYDTFSNTAESLFRDVSGRDDFQDDHYWFAELYLVEVPDPTKPKEVRIYNGVKWGWTNTVTPPTTGGGGCNGSSGGGGCARTFINQEQLLSDDANASYSVPEPISTLGLLVLGAWGIFQGLKIRKDK